VLFGPTYSSDRPSRSGPLLLRYSFLVVGFNTPLIAPLLAPPELWLQPDNRLSLFSSGGDLIRISRRASMDGWISGCWCFPRHYEPLDVPCRMVRSSAACSFFRPIFGEYHGDLMFDTGSTPLGAGCVVFRRVRFFRSCIDLFILSFGNCCWVLRGVIRRIGRNRSGGRMGNTAHQSVLYIRYIHTHAHADREYL